MIIVFVVSNKVHVWCHWLRLRQQPSLLYKKEIYIQCIYLYIHVENGRIKSVYIALCLREKELKKKTHNLE